MQTPNIPSTERSVRFGYHWAVARQIDRIGRSIERNTNVSSQVHYLKSLCYPFWKDDEEFQELWEKIKEEISKEKGLKNKEKYAKLRREQLNLLISLLWEHEVLVDEGIPIENINLLERRS